MVGSIVLLLALVRHSKVFIQFLPFILHHSKVKKNWKCPQGSFSKNIDKHSRKFVATKNKEKKKSEKTNPDLCDIYCSFKPLISTFKEDQNIEAFGFKKEKKLMKVGSFYSRRNKKFIVWQTQLILF